jgi:hypothetical protein
VAGVYSLEQNAWRWTSGRASFLLKAPDGPTPLRASLNVYEKSPATRLTLQLDGETVFEQALRPGALEIVTPPVQPRKETAVVTLTVDRTFQAPGDQRELGVIVAAIGFR